jgi:hypothetical protein
MSSNFRRIEFTLGGLGSVAILSAFAAPTNADTIILDTFDRGTVGSTANLSYSTPDQSQQGDTWNPVNSPGNLVTNGSLAETTSSTGFAKGFLNFAPVTVPFELSANLSVSVSGSDIWIGYTNDNGYTMPPPPQNGNQGNWNNGEPTSGPLWGGLLYDSSVTTGNPYKLYFSASGNGYAVYPGSESENVGINYDPSTDTATFLGNGVVLGSEIVSGGLTMTDDVTNLPVATNVVGIKVDGNNNVAGGDTIGDFKITDVPEPTSLLSLAALGVGGLMARRRRA